MLKFNENLCTAQEIDVDNKGRFRYFDVRRSGSFELLYIGL